jgi:hypothetical protein
MPTEAWQNELLTKPYIPGVKILRMPEEHRRWLRTQVPLVFVADETLDGLVNLYHPENVRRW